METCSIPQRFTLNDVVDFCYENKRHRGFSKFAKDEIAAHIIWANDNGKLSIVADSKGLCGVCTYSDYPASKSLYIHHIVTTRTGFPTFIAAAKHQFPDYTIKGLRSGKLITFNTRHLWAIVLQAQQNQQKKC